MTGVRRPRLLIAVIAFAALLGTLTQALFVPLLGILPDELGVSATAVSWLITGVLVTGVVASAVLGRLADMYGRRRMLLIALAVFVLGSALGTVGTDIGVLILARAMQGVAMATVPIGIGILRDALSGRQLVGGLALVSSTIGVAGVLGTVVSGVVAQLWSWRWLFVGAAVLGAIAIAAVLIVVPAIRIARIPTAGNPTVAGPTRPRMDLPGAIGLSAGLVAVLLGISEGAVWGWLSAPTLGCLLGGALVLAVWAAWELRSPAPLIDLRLLVSRPVLFANVAAVLIGFGFYGLVIAGPRLALVPEETGFGLGASVALAGATVLPALATTALAPVLATAVIHRRGPRAGLAVGAGMLVLGHISVLVWHSSIPALMVANALVLGGVAVSLAAVPLLLIQGVPAAQTAEANGLNSVFRTVGTSTSSAVVTAALIGWSMPGAPDTPAHGAFLLVFAISGAACLAIFAVIATLGRAPRRARQP